MHNVLKVLIIKMIGTVLSKIINILKYIMTTQTINII